MRSSSIGNVAVLLIWPDETWSSVLRNMNLLISVILFADFFALLYRAKSKRAYFIRGWGWADFLGSFPIPGFRLFRLFRFFYISRKLRKEGIVGLRRGIRTRISESTLIFVTLGLILTLEFGCVLILSAEADKPNANIRTGGDAMWWAMVTIATVGYGDYYPVTTYGRLIGSLMMIVSISLVAVFTAFIANSFFKRQTKEEERRSEEASAAGESTDVLREEIAHLRLAVRDLQASLDRMSGGGT